MAAASEAVRTRDTAGTYLKEVLASAREQYPDANLVGVTGSADRSGSVVCDPRSPAVDGWHYHFYSAERDAFLLIAECRGYVVGPMKELRSAAGAGERVPITGKFFDSDEALKAVAAGGVPLEPGGRGSRGKRPFRFSLLRVDDPRFKDFPVFWEVELGNARYMVNAETHRIEREVLARDPGVSPIAGSGSDSMSVRPTWGDLKSTGAAPSPLSYRPKKAKGYSARKDFDKVRDYARKKLPGAVLMGVDGIADAWGYSECLGSGDGWAYYFYWKRKRSIETVWACRGQVHPGNGAYIPVSLDQHQEVPAAPSFIDSDKAMDGLLLGRQDVMNEGMGRFYTRRVPMRLLSYKAPPFSSPELWKRTVLWEAQIGMRLYYVDAATGKFLAERRQ